MRESTFPPRLRSGGALQIVPEGIKIKVQSHDKTSVCITWLENADRMYHFLYSAIPAGKWDRPLR